MTDLNGYPDSSPIPLSASRAGEYERRTLDTVVVKLKSLHEDVTDMKDVLRDLTVAINRLALVEERQIQTANALERAFVALSKVEVRLTEVEQTNVVRTLPKLEDRVSKLELSNVNTSRTSASFDKIIWMVVTAVGTAILTSVVIGAHK